jgi:FAD:protein FMN transferase
MLLEWFDTAAEPINEVTLLRFSRRAMATTFEIALPFGTPNAYEAAYDALDLIDDLESQLTVYRDSSEVSQLNARASHEAIPVEPRLFELFQTCASLTRETAGAFDVGIGSLIRAWGFLNRAGQVPDPDALQTAREQSGFRHVILSPESRSMKYRKTGLEINLGSIGKGYALDRAAELLREKWGIESALLHGGGSSVYAVGHPPGLPRGWGVAIRHPANDGRTLKTAWLRDQGLGTSAATFQHFLYNGRYLGHLLDPRSGWPAEGLASVSAVAPSASLADAWSTAWFVLGEEAAQEHCRTRTDLAALTLDCAAEARPLTFGSNFRWTD